jgi:CBS domain-containing protein
MVIGAFLGLAVWRILLPIAPGVGHTPAPFIVVGMMAVFGSISRAPLAVMIMVAEMIGVNNLLSPAMIAVAIATFIVFRADKSIYKSQLHNRNSQIVNNLINKGDIASLEKIEQAMRDPVLVLTKDESIKSAYEMLQEKNLPGAPVVDERGTFLGTVDTMDILSFAGDMEKSAVVQLLDATAPSCQMTASLQEGFEGIYQAGGRFLTVTDGNRLVVGIITVGGLLRAYRASLAGSITKLSKLMPHSQVVEYEIADTSPLVGRKVNQIRFPMGIIIFSLKRNNELILISNETVFTRGDRVNILCRPENMEEIKKLAEGTSSPVMGSNV